MNKITKRECCDCCVLKVQGNRLFATIDMFRLVIKTGDIKNESRDRSKCVYVDLLFLVSQRISTLALKEGYGDPFERFRDDDVGFARFEIICLFRNGLNAVCDIVGFNR